MPGIAVQHLIAAAMRSIQTGRLEEAERELRGVLARDAANAEAIELLGVCLLERGLPGEALAQLERALALRPASEQALFAKGAAMLELGDGARARACLAELVRLRPDLAWAWNNLGLAHMAAGDLDSAVAAFERARALDARFDLAHANLANALMRLDRPDAARAAYLQALELDPRNGSTRWNLGLCRLLLGEWPEAWSDYEARWTQTQMPIFAPRNFFARPRWFGAHAVRDRTVFLHAEQGLGDTLQFCRYAPLLGRLGARVVLEVPLSMCNLVARSFGPAIEVIARGAPIPAFDLHCPLMGLPLAFQTTPATVPAEVPYLRPDAGRLRAWEARLGPRTRPRLGLAWSSGISDPRRDVPLEALRPLDGGRFELVTLQPEVRGSDAAALASFANLRSHGKAIADFDDTAALASLCDLVISVDTAVAHLAGGLGGEVWILLARAADWRWLRERDDTPWYPSARLFRQRTAGRWNEVVGEVMAALTHRFESPYGRMAGNASPGCSNRRLA